MSRRAVPGELGERERTALVAVADALLAGNAEVPSPSALPDYGEWLERALAAREDSRQAAVGAALEIANLEPGMRREALRNLDAEDPGLFHVLSSIVAGAYLLVPAVAAAIGYPGQEKAPAPFDEAAEELASGILEPVLARGSICRLPEAPRERS